MAKQKKAAKQNDGGAGDDGVAVLTVEVPVVEVTAIVGMHTDVNLDRRQRLGLSKLLSGLRARGATLANGRPVWRVNDALRWLLEQLATEAEAAPHRTLK